MILSKTLYKFFVIISPLVISRQHSGIIVKKEITRNNISFDLNELNLLIGFMFINVNNTK